MFSDFQRPKKSTHYRSQKNKLRTLSLAGKPEERQKYVHWWAQNRSFDLVSNWLGKMIALCFKIKVPITNVGRSSSVLEENTTTIQSNVWLWKNVYCYMSPTCKGHHTDTQDSWCEKSKMAKLYEWYGILVVPWLPSILVRGSWHQPNSTHPGQMLLLMWYFPLIHKMSPELAEDWTLDTQLGGGIMFNISAVLIQVLMLY